MPGASHKKNVCHFHSEFSFLGNFTRALMFSMLPSRKIPFVGGPSSETLCQCILKSFLLGSREGSFLFLAFSV